MTENLLVSAMKDSLVDEWEGTVADLMECSIDSILKDGVLKDIPVVGIAMSVCKTGAEGGYQLLCIPAVLVLPPVEPAEKICQ